VRCDDCYRQWCDTEKERHARAMDEAMHNLETPLGQLLDDNPIDD
jgi:hypothetical protein